MNDTSSDSTKNWRIKVSNVALNTKNPIRGIVDNLKVPNIPGKALIPLSLGDPAVFGNLNPPELLIRTVKDHLEKNSANGYIHSAGTVTARAAIAKYMETPTSLLTADDIVIASGCSGALDLAITAMLNPGDVLLLPQPSFPLYATLCKSKGIDVAYYPLKPEKNWEVDIEALRQLIVDTPRATTILINNPSNPCGSVFSKEHLLEILSVAEEFGLPIISDEIYGHLVFPSRNAVFHPIASLTSTVPVIAASGIAKEFLVPGWRVGWLAVHDRNNLLKDIRSALYSLTQLILGANSLVLSALPAILTPEKGSEEEASMQQFRKRTVSQLEKHAQLCMDRLAKIPGLEVINPQGTMYVMFKISPGRFKDFLDDVEFAKALLNEENVFVLPGQAFGMKHFCRIVFCAPEEKLNEAFDRMEAFCTKYYTPAV